jgi:hypothetical protein
MERAYFKEGCMFEIQIHGESGEWYRIDDPYRHRAVAVDDAIVLEDRYHLHGHLRVVPVEAA